MKAIKEVVGKFKGCGAYKQSVKLRSAYGKRRSGRLSRLGISTQIRVDITSQLSQRLTAGSRQSQGLSRFWAVTPQGHPLGIWCIACLRSTLSDGPVCRSLL